MANASPLRYPGGKAAFSDFLTDVIDLNDLRACAYFEPYAGGAGAALELLKNGVVSDIYLNDADPRIYSFWYSALVFSSKFTKRILSVPLTLSEWYKQQHICLNPFLYSQFKVGFAAFYMNRCNRSGVLDGSGPIGGYKQDGKWRLDVRFNRERLAERIIAIARLRKHIHVFCMDAIVFLKDQLPRGKRRKHVFVYLDPPYVNHGPRLYLNAYNSDDHALIAKYLHAQKSLPWIMSYDDCSLIRELYSAHNIALLPTKYTFQKKRRINELLIAPHHLSTPSACRIAGRESLLEEIS
jgi:DNA adenine methylase